MANIVSVCLPKTRHHPRHNYPRYLCYILSGYFLKSFLITILFLMMSLWKSGYIMVAFKIL